ncbi:hypothetical protein ON010_g13126 [Phytophthora cinnamomi]|nr:hypothetical protein ON010_g13126 [Phytophthora cinnamomi]
MSPTTRSPPVHEIARLRRQRLHRWQYSTYHTTSALQHSLVSSTPHTNSRSDESICHGGQVASLSPQRARSVEPPRKWAQEPPPAPAFLSRSAPSTWMKVPGWRTGLEARRLLASERRVSEERLETRWQTRQWMGRDLLPERETRGQFCM